MKSGLDGLKAMHKMRKEKIAVLVEQVVADELTPEEAAQSLAGATLKVLEEYGGADGIDRDEVLRQAQHDIDSRLPGYEGIVLGRHM